MVFLKRARAMYLENLALFTSGIGGSAREVNNLVHQIGDCFQVTGIKREVNQDLEEKEVDLQFSK